MVDKLGGEKISENKIIAEIIKKSTQDKKYFVIYNGPMKGVYDAWKKAAPFTHQSKIIHKGGFLTLEEAKESFREYVHPEQTLRRADKAPIQAQRTGIMRNIPTRAEIKEKKRVYRSNLRETLNIILNLTEEKRAILGYYPIAKEQLTKLVIFPDASPSDTYQFFQYGLIDTILIFNDLKIISEFPAGFVDAVKRFKNMIDNVNPRDVSLKFTNSQPIFNEEEECLVPAYQVIFMSVFSGNFQSIDQIQDLTIYSHERRLASTHYKKMEHFHRRKPPSVRAGKGGNTNNQKEEKNIGGCFLSHRRRRKICHGCLLCHYHDRRSDSHSRNLTLARVFERTQKITKESHTRINYKSRNTLLVSSKRNKIEEREMRLLVEFESAFYNLSRLLEKLPEGIRRNLCYLIKDKEDHRCQLCASKISEESNNKMRSTHMIKEEDSASETSLNIIA
ncbi:hypothetical protein Ahy_B02g061636 [Arachis hypogaea]|uniref:Uncharacterized protein n=1 Tax=Arachis hypogaea TaxID=3818 RepID=A0A445ALH5_ARAHY|nr:hypothetical protein Ahy_B02g061636 [Arachis hypogaea]